MHDEHIYAPTALSAPTPRRRIRSNNIFARPTEAMQEILRIGQSSLAISASVQPEISSNRKRPRPYALLLRQVLSKRVPTLFLVGLGVLSGISIVVRWTMDTSPMTMMITTIRGRSPLSTRETRPLTVRLLGDGGIDSFSLLRTERLKPLANVVLENHTNPLLVSTKSEEEDQQSNCKAMHDWQKSIFPTCNLIHETDLYSVRGTVGNGGSLYCNRDQNDSNDSFDSDERLHHTCEDEVYVQFVDNGAFRDVWMVREANGNKRVLKTLRYDRPLTKGIYESHRLDAIVYERLTASPFIVDTYGFCGNSGLFDYSTEGNIKHVIRDGVLTSMDMLRLSLQVASAIATLHEFDSQLGRGAAIAHSDVSASQFILVDGTYKLNDFNKCNFIQWDEIKQEPCKFYTGNKAGASRSPEEYDKEYLTEKVRRYTNARREKDFNSRICHETATNDTSHPSTRTLNNWCLLLFSLLLFVHLYFAKIDVFSMGNVMHRIITGHYPKKLEQPPSYLEIEETGDSIQLVVLKAIQMARRFDPTKRSTASEVMNYLRAELKILDLQNVTATTL